MCSTMAPGDSDASTTSASVGSSRVSNWLSSKSAFMKWFFRSFRRERISAADAFKYTHRIRMPRASTSLYSCLSADQPRTRSWPQSTASRIRSWIAEIHGPRSASVNGVRWHGSAPCASHGQVRPSLSCSATCLRGGSVSAAWSRSSGSRGCSWSPSPSRCCCPDSPDIWVTQLSRRTDGNWALASRMNSARILSQKSPPRTRMLASSKMSLASE